VGVEQLAQCSRLDQVFLTDADDETVSRFEGWRRLRRFHVSGTGVTDESIPALASLRGCRVISVTGTSLTRRGRDRLKRLLPDCHIEWLHGSSDAESQ
jgi:hypothetical protein